MLSFKLNSRVVFDQDHGKADRYLYAAALCHTILSSVSYDFPLILRLERIISGRPTTFRQVVKKCCKEAKKY
jgi:hypothetical protein